ncbi:MAG: hypothetical protein J7K51_03370 [Thermotogae bacterium]|nr:hypothetical protein [Thermotogota bacterium]
MARSTPYFTNLSNYLNWWVEISKCPRMEIMNAVFVKKRKVGEGCYGGRA